MRKLIITLAFLFLMVLVTGCVKTTTTTQGSIEDPIPYTLESYDFETVYEDKSGKKTLNRYVKENPKYNGNVEYAINKNIGSKNYIRLEYETSTNIVGYINYVNALNPSQSNSEKFYIEKDTTEFTMFLDAFRGGAFGNYNKIITSITFQNVDTEVEGEFTFKSFSISDRTYDPNYDMFIDDGTIKVGTSLSFGGCIKYLYRLDLDIVEYIDDDGNVRIDQDIDTDYVSNVISTDVNFVNIYDLGREIQQSYYLTVDESNGYIPTSAIKYEGAGGILRYNPIQCGSAGQINPQIIDFTFTEKEIYVKSIGQDWFLENSLTQCYLENRFYFGDDGVLLVECKTTNFAQFTGVDDTEVMGQETPATYFVYPLNYFYCETRQGIIMDNNLHPDISSQPKTTKDEKVDGNYFYRIKGRNVPQGWMAFVNDNKFGVGIYMPNADFYSASRGKTSTSYMGEKTNTQYLKTMWDLGEDDLISSAITMNYNYCNPMVRGRMVDFVPLEYTYALYIGEVQEMKQAFNALKDSGLDNSELLTAWPKK